MYYKCEHMANTVGPKYRGGWGRRGRNKRGIMTMMMMMDRRRKKKNKEREMEEETT